jgi:predicted outer membrane repeat protein
MKSRRFSQVLPACVGLLSLTMLSLVSPAATIRIVSPDGVDSGLAPHDGMGPVFELAGAGTVQIATRTEGTVFLAFPFQTVYLLGQLEPWQTSVPEYRILPPGPTFRLFAPSVSGWPGGGVLAFLDYHTIIGGGIPDEYDVGFHLLTSEGASSRFQASAASLVSFSSERVYVGSSMNAAGEFGLVYHDNRDDRSARCLARVFGTDGQPLGAEFEANDPEERAANAAIAMAADGTAVIVWESQRLLEGLYQAWDIRARRFKADGSAQGPAWRVNTILNCRHKRPAIAMAPDGSYTVVWYQRYSHADGLYLRRFGPADQPLGTEALVSPRYEIPSPTHDLPDVEPQVAGASDGGFVVLWNRVGSGQQALPNQGIFAQRFNSDASRLGGSFRLDEPGTNATQYPRVGMGGNGTFLVTWREVGVQPDLTRILKGTYGRWVGWEAQPTAGPDHGPVVLSQEPSATTTAPAGAVSVRFDRPMDSLSTSPSDVAITDSDGWAVPLTTLGFDDPQTLRLTFPPQDLPGTYHVAVGPDITDLTGRRMGSDGDILDGEPGDSHRGTFDIPVTQAARLPFFEGFEPGAGTRAHWHYAGYAPGGVVVTAVDEPHRGTAHLAFAARTTPAGAVHAASLHLDLSDHASAGDLELAFWARYDIRSFSSQFRVEISNDAERWGTVLTESRAAAQPDQRWVIDLDEACRINNVSLERPIQVRFGFGTSPGETTAGNNILYLDDVTVLSGQIPVVFSAHPESRVARAGDEVQFFAPTVASEPVELQWLHNGMELSGETGETLLLPAVTSEQAGEYTARATLGGATAVSEPATLIVVTTSDDAHEQAVRADAPLAHWRLGESAGSVAVDAIVSHDGVYLNGVLLGRPGAVPRDPDTAAGFAADRETEVRVPFSSELNPSAFTVEAWVLPARAPGGRGVLTTLESYYSGGSDLRYRGYEMGVSADGRWLFRTGDATGVPASLYGPIVLPGRWTHLACSHDGTTKRLFVNGQLVGMQATGFVPNQVSPVSIGTGRTLGFFDGSLDEVAIYDHALRPDRVLRHYQSGVSPPPPAVTTLADSGPGSLRQALREVWAGNTIRFETNGVIALTSGGLVVDRDVAVAGPGADRITVDGQLRGRVLEVRAGQVALSGLRIVNGLAGWPDPEVPVFGHGGGIESQGTLAISDCVFSNNLAVGSGGAIHAAGAFSVSNCVFEGNVAVSGGALGVAEGVEGRVTHARFRGNSADADGDGGAVRNRGVIELSSCEFENNVAPLGNGGALYNEGQLLLVDSVLRNNAAQGDLGGGGLANAGSARMVRSHFTGNTTFGQGGAILNWAGGVAELEDSTLSGNSSFHGAQGIAVWGGTLRASRCALVGNAGQFNWDGGALLVWNADATLTNCTISGNHAAQGGGIHLRQGSVTLNHCTVVGNGPNNLSQETGSFSVGNSIVAAGTTADLSGTFTSAGHNLIGRHDKGATGFAAGVNGDVVGSADVAVNPFLGPLQDNGGLTPTHALLAGSPAIDQAQGGGVATDQRGQPRPIDQPEYPNAAAGEGGDMGAFEAPDFNSMPVVETLEDRIVNECEAVEWSVLGADPLDDPPHNLGLSASGLPEGATLDPATGRFTWTPSEAQGPGSYTVTFTATDDGVPPLSASETVTITVTEVNAAPELAVVEDRVVGPGTMVELLFQATDADLPPNLLSFTLLEGPAEAELDPATGRFSWSVPLADSGRSLTIRVSVHDDAPTPQAASRSFVVRVRDVRPAFAPNGAAMTAGGFVLRFRGEPGLRFKLEGSEDLREWGEVGEVVVGAEGEGVAVDESPGAGHRFYRLRWIE